MSREWLQDCFLFGSSTHGLFEEFSTHDNSGGSQDCDDCGACKQLVEHVLVECASYDSQRQIFWTT